VELEISNIMNHGFRGHFIGQTRKPRHEKNCMEFCSTLNLSVTAFKVGTLYNSIIEKKNKKNSSFYSNNLIHDSHKTVRVA